MAGSKAATPDAYLEELDPARSAELRPVREMISQAMPEGFVERMAWGMISWELPLELSGPTHNKQPLLYAALAAQKKHNALYLTCAHADLARRERLGRAFAVAGKKLDMGKSCIRFRRADDLALPAIAAEIASLTPQQFVVLHQQARER